MIKRQSIIVGMVMLILGVCRFGYAQQDAAPEGEMGGPTPTAAVVMPTATDDSYKVGYGDVLEISVWKDEGLTKKVTVLPDGKFQFPLVGDIYAYGKTVQEIQTEIVAKISRFVPDPILSVEVDKVQSMIIYVIGRVNRPGQYSLNKEVNVLQALSLAGGLNPFAERDEIKIFRSVGDVTDVLLFDYDQVASGENLGMNIVLKRDDVVLVP